MQDLGRPYLGPFIDLAVPNIQPPPLPHLRPAAATARNQISASLSKLIGHLSRRR